MLYVFEEETEDNTLLLLDLPLLSPGYKWTSFNTLPRMYARYPVRWLDGIRLRVMASGSQHWRSHLYLLGLLCDLNLESSCQPGPLVDA